MKKVSVLGLGYVGLPLYAAISKSGKYDVMGYDPQSSKIESLNKGKCPIDDEQCERDLSEIKSIDVSDKLESISGSDIYIICVPTPVMDGYTPDYRYVEGAAKDISKYLKKGDTVILESTVNPGTCDEILTPVLERESGLSIGDDFAVAHCPERINPGDPKWTVYNIPRNVGTNPESRNVEVADFYRSFLESEINEVSSVKVAEATKIVENTFRDINIAFVNELAQSFDKMGIDLIETLNGAGNKPFAFMPHWPGRGVGGHCIAVDPYYLIRKAEKVGFDHKFVKLARRINNSMPEYAVKRVIEGLIEAGAEDYLGKKITVLGLSYKPNIDDLRESPSFEIIELAKTEGFDVVTYDQRALDASTASTLEESLSSSIAVIVSTAHTEYLKLDEILTNYPNIRVVVDGMNKLDKVKIESLGMVYKGIGR